MKSKILILGATDAHPERKEKLPKFLSVLCKIADEVTLVSSTCPDEFINKVNWIKVKDSPQSNTKTKIGKFIDVRKKQLLLSGFLLSQIGKKQTVVTLRRYELPALIARLILKKPIRYHASSPSFKYSSTKYLARSEKLANLAYSKIALPSQSCIVDYGLDRYKNKSVIAPFHVEDIFFKKENKMKKRKSYIGYFGNLTFKESNYRAVDNLVKGFKKFNADEQKYHLVLGGIGPMEEQLKNSETKEIMLTGWLGHKQVKDWLDEFQLLVLPSIKEGLATILLQAMIRGTPVLATNVSGNPDVIEDEKTGFLMESTDPTCIASNIHRALSHPDLWKIAKTGKEFAEKRYNFHIISENWKKVIK